jgi:hypothetical protein
MGLYEMIDEAMAFELGVDVEIYIDVIENKCTLEEADLILDIIWKEGDIEEAKQLFNKIKNKNDNTTINQKRDHHQIRWCSSRQENYHRR